MAEPDKNKIVPYKNSWSPTLADSSTVGSFRLTSSNPVCCEFKSTSDSIFRAREFLLVLQK